MSDDVEAIAKRLTKAQREAVIGGQERANGVVLVQPKLSQVGGMTTYYSFLFERLTPLGLAVRAYLQENDNV